MKYRVSTHAVQRWNERVEVVPDAIPDILGFLYTGSASKRPRRWMRRDRGIPHADDLSFVHHHDYPGVCLVVRGNVVLTVVTRDLVSVGGGRRRRGSYPGRRAA